MFNSKMIGANSAGASQDPGTGAFLFTSNASDGTGGMWISVDDGQSWNRNAILGINPTDYTLWNNSIKWMGSNFVTIKSGTTEIWSSPDGYNWSYNFTPAGNTVIAPYLDQITGSAFISSYVSNSSMYTYKSTNGGLTWAYNGTASMVNGGYPTMATMHNGQGMGITGSTAGNMWSNDNGVTWTTRNETQGRGTPMIVQNGRWSAMVMTITTSGTTTTTPTARMSFWTSTSLTSQGFSSYITSATNHVGDGVSKILNMFIYGGTSVYYLAYSTNNGATYTPWKIIDTYQNVGWHNGYFFYRYGGNLYKTNNFSTETLVSLFPSTAGGGNASMSYLW